MYQVIELESGRGNVNFGQL